MVNGSLDTIDIWDFAQFFMLNSEEF
ncbi:hypothetical protein Gorai_002580 [Gossypium raimondii]|uniref:Uncharacterized protein n=1 Tax=Gossypium raimondii TaxID=29730 RepID=A0A7J8QMA3_GOSRA|nr:hypothetical protein [Gossypium raimondii]